MFSSSSGLGTGSSKLEYVDGRYARIWESEEACWIGSEDTVDGCYARIWDTEDGSAVVSTEDTVDGRSSYVRLSRILNIVRL